MKIFLNVFIKYNTFFVAIVLSIISVVSLFHPGLPPTHDGEYHVVRFYEFDKALRSGSVYPIWASDLNFTFGVPLFNYVYPLPNYIASFAHVFGSSFIDAFKFNLIAASLLGAITSYALGRQKFGKWGGLLTSVFYTYAPYHFLDIYIRGSVGEVWALAFFPLPIIFINKLLYRHNVYDQIFLGLSLGLIVFSHNILSLMYMGFIVSYVFVFAISKKTSLKGILSIGLGVLLSFLLTAIFIIPALFESKFVVGLNTFTVIDHFPDLSSLLIPSWGSGYSGISVANQMSFQIGAANIMIICIVVVTLILKKFKKEKLYVLFFLAWFLFLIFLMNPSSSFLWESVPGMSYFQFPWRLLSLVILACAILAGSLASAYTSRIFYSIVFMLAVITTYQYAHAPYFFDRQDSHYIKRSNFIHGTNSIGNGFQTKWLSQQKALPSDSSVIISGKGEIRLLEKTATYQLFEADIKSPSIVRFNTAYFPGWTVYSESSKVAVKNSSGVIEVPLRTGQQRVKLRLENTMLRKTAKLVTLFTVISVLILLAFPVLQLRYGSRFR